MYGVGLALTFDEFGLWFHLGGSYWQRASFDVVVVIAGLLGLVMVAPAWKHLRPHQQGAWGPRTRYSARAAGNLKSATGPCARRL